jgi:hypothetical protein
MVQENEFNPDKSMSVVFTSFRDSRDLPGLKLSLDRHLPKQCGQPILGYLSVPKIDSLTQASIESVYKTVLDNNWELVKTFLDDMFELGIRQVVLCDWATKEQIENSKFCAAGIIGRYISNRDLDFDFPVQVSYRDGRESL